MNKEVVLDFNQSCWELVREYHDEQLNFNYLQRYKHILKKDQTLIVTLLSNEDYIVLNSTDTVTLKLNKYPSDNYSISDIINNISVNNNEDKVVICAVLTLLILISEGYLNTYSEPMNRKNRRSIKKTLNTDVDVVHKICIIQSNKFKSTYGLPTFVRQKEHTRRGHYRKYRSGKTIFIESYTAGDKSLGSITKDYVIK